MNGAADGQSDSRRVSPVESGKIVEKDRWDLGRKGVCLWLHGRSCKNIPKDLLCFFLLGFGKFLMGPPPSTRILLNNAIQSHLNRS